MSNKIIATASRVSEYLDKQAIREKEKRKEKILTILPTFIERELSGITDKESLYKTIPKLSAELYTYGADVGNAANQILGNLAQTKLREFGEIDAKKNYQDYLEGVKDAYGGKKFDDGKGGSTDIAGMIERVSKLDPSIGPQVLQQQLEMKAITTKGIVEDKGNAFYYQTYETTKGGVIRPGERFAIDRKASTMDLLGAGNEGNENLPYTPEVTDFMNKLQEEQRQKQAQLGNSMAMARYQWDLQIKKMEEMDLNKIRALKYYDTKTGKQIRADKDETGHPYFYYEDTQKAPDMLTGGNPLLQGLEERVRVPIEDFSNVEEIGQFGVNTSLKSGEIGRLKTLKNEKLISAGKELATSMGWDDTERMAIKDGNYYDDTKIDVLYKDFINKYKDNSGNDLTKQYDAGELVNPTLLKQIGLNEKLIPAFIKWQEYKKDSQLYNTISGEYQGQFNGDSTTPQQSTNIPDRYKKR